MVVVGLCGLRRLSNQVVREGRRREHTGVMEGKAVEERELVACRWCRGLSGTVEPYMPNKGIGLARRLGQWVWWIV